MDHLITINRTYGGHKDFVQLIGQLANELWNELKEDQATYDQYNEVTHIDTAIVLYENEKPVACGCFKKHHGGTVEIKRMYVVKECRGKKYAKKVLQELEGWASELGFTNAILETSIHFKAARSLYMSSGYHVIENYDQYKGLVESVCMKKELTSNEKPSAQRL